MSDKQIKLSICMMAKDEEKNLKRCLDSLSPLLEKPYVELIIVDTGSEDSTADIARQYTSRVYFHPWNNNFSEMRNISISYAEGEWIFIIDADEELKDTKELISLFESRRTEGYNTILVRVVNFLYENQEEDVNIINMSKRLFRNDGSFHYEGAVHNQPAGKGPELTTGITLLHYGYIVNDKDTMEKKFNRTVSILKAELEKDPGNIYYQHQLAVSYANFDMPQALIEIRKTYGLIKRLPPEKQGLYSYVYGIYARISYANKKLAETIKICNEGIGLVGDYIDLHYKLGCCYIDLNEEEEAAGHFEKYLDLCGRYDRLKISRDSAFVMYHLDRKSKSIACYNLSVFYFKQKDYAKSLEYAFQMKDTREMAAIILKNLLGLKDFARLGEYYDSLGENEELKRVLAEYIEVEKSKLDEQDRLELERVFAGRDDIYGMLNKVRVSPDKAVAVGVRNVVNTCDFNELPLFYSDLFRFAMDGHNAVISVFKNINSQKLKNIICYLIDKYEDVKNGFIEHLISAAVPANDLQGLRVHRITAGVILLKEAENAKKENREIGSRFHEAFKRYIKIGIDYVSRIYQLDRMRLFNKMLSDEEDRFFILLHFMNEAAGRGNDRATLKYFREALEAYPYMAPYMKKYKGEVFPHQEEDREESQAL